MARKRKSKRQGRDAEAIALVAGFIKNGRPTPFTFEGFVVHFLRSTWCLNGEAYAEADAKARRVVLAALKQIGARRPTEFEASREYADARENCLLCTKPLDFTATEPWRHAFCSELCCRAWNVKREAAMYYWTTREYGRFKYGLLKASLPTRSCEWCGKSFRPSWPTSRFCSRECAGRGRHDAVPEKQCETCGTAFRGWKGQRFCSNRCRAIAQHAVRFESICRTCGTAFQASSPRAMYCSNRCKKIAWKARAA